MIAAYLVLNMLLAMILYAAPEFRRWIFGILLLGIIGAELKDRTREGRYLLQGHAIWHILGAVAAWYLYLHYDHVTRIRQ